MTTVLAEHDFLASAERVHQIAGYSFPEIFSEYFAHHHVIKTPIFFLMAKEQDGAWFVWWLETHPQIQRSSTPRMLLRALLKHMPYRLPRIAWARPFKGRVDVEYYSTERLLRFTR